MRDKTPKMDKGKDNADASVDLAGELLADPVPGALERVTDALALGVGRPVGGGRVGSLGARVRLIDEVASSATADVVDGCGALPQALLLSKFLVEAEHGAFLLAVHVASAATARSEESVWWRSGDLNARSGSSGIRALGNFLGVHAGCVASTATSGIVVVGGGDGRVGFGDVVGRHCCGCVGCS